MVQQVKESTCNAEDKGVAGSIPGSGICPGEGKRQPTPVFTPEKIPWTEEPGGLQFKGLQRLGHE